MVITPSRQASIARQSVKTEANPGGTTVAEPTRQSDGVVLSGSNAGHTGAMTVAKTAVAVVGGVGGALLGGLKAVGASSLGNTLPVLSLAYGAYALADESISNKYLPLIFASSAVDALAGNPVVSSIAQAVTIGASIGLIAHDGTEGVAAGWNLIG